MQIELSQLFLLMVTAGVLGGVTNIFIAENLENQKVNFNYILTSIISGISASLLVPLFLNTLKSSLLIDIFDDQQKRNSNDLLIFFGFCLLAAISSRKFIKSLADRIIQEAINITQKEIRDTKEEVIVTKEEVISFEKNFKERMDKLEKDIKSIDISNTMHRIITLTREQKFIQASAIIKNLLINDSNNIILLLEQADTLMRSGVIDHDYTNIHTLQKIISSIRQAVTCQENIIIQKSKLIEAKCLYIEVCCDVILNKNRDFSHQELERKLSKCFILDPAFAKHALIDNALNPIKGFEWFEILCNRFKIQKD